MSTWLRTPAGWRIIGTQVLAISEDPPAAALDSARLCAYEGVFALTPEITSTIRCSGNALTAERAGRPAVT